MACDLSKEECFRKYVVAVLPVIERGQGWYSMRCPVGTHGKPLRFHTGDRAHISWTDLGHCPEQDVFAWIISRGVPGECVRRPKVTGPKPQFGDTDAKLADAIIGEAFGEGTPAERLIRIAVLALGDETPEGSVVDILADRLRLKPRIIYQATAERRRKGRDW